MRQLILSSLIFSFFYIPTAIARTDCPKAKVEIIQVERTIIHYRQAGAPWRHLGRIDEPGTKERYSALLAAQMANKAVTVGYPHSNYNCSKVNYNTAAHIVRTYKD